MRKGLEAAQKPRHAWARAGRERLAKGWEEGVKELEIKQAELRERGKV